MVFEVRMYLNIFSIEVHYGTDVKQGELVIALAFSDLIDEMLLTERWTEKGQQYREVSNFSGIQIR